MKTYSDGVHIISSADYHQSAGYSRSALWELNKSPKHFFSKYLSEEPQITKPSKAMLLGELVHVMALEPEQLVNYIEEHEYAPLPKVGLLKDLGREEFERQKETRQMVQDANETAERIFEELSEGKTIVERETWFQALQMAHILHGGDDFKLLTEDAKIENSIFWTHKKTGLQFKARPDIWKGRVVTDLKTTSDASYNGFQRSCLNFGYFLQAGMIALALESIGQKMNGFVFSCIETSAPFCSVLYPLDAEAIQYGKDLFESLAVKLARCLEKNEFKSYENQTMCVPKWAPFIE